VRESFKKDKEKSSSMKKLIFSVMAFAAIITVKAQQDPAYSMYMFNGLFINPAYAGSQEVISLMGIVRDQWVGIDGAPKTANISVHSPLRQDQYALGLVVSNDNLGFSNTLNFTPSFAYRLRLPHDVRLCFGVQATLAYYYQNNSRAQVADQTQTDNAFGANEKLFVPNFGAGIYAYGRRFFIGFSVPHLLPSALGQKTGVVTNSNVAQMYNAYIFTAGYVFGKEPAIVKFRPTILMKYQQGLYKNIPQFDISPALLFVDRVWLGVTYRTGGNFSYMGQAFIVFVQAKITPQLQLGYAYDAELSSLAHYTSGSHEIMIGYDFWYNKKRFVTPRYVKYF
jgi:type IX secretion system PorP/SprF family membrane protein